MPTEIEVVEESYRRGLRGGGSVTSLIRYCEIVNNLGARMALENERGILC